MFLSAYHFDGDPEALLAAYRSLMAGFPPEAIELNLCVARASGITVLDACPTREVFEAFSTGAEFRGALDAAGLPAPRIEPLGEVHAIRAKAEALR